MTNDGFSFINEELREFWPFVEQFYAEEDLLIYGVLILDFEPSLLRNIVLSTFPPVFSSVYH